jgi:diguanylate cyclase (GGDEF)-like protein
VTDRVTIGCVMLVAPKPGVFTFEQQRLVDRLVRLASVGIQNARLHSKTLELAETDSMTGLLTNRAYQERLEGEFRRAQLSKQSLALLIADVDFFKHVNDTYGHPQGDELLRQLGEVIRMHARKIDICCRYGGDEFVVAIPRCTSFRMHRVADDLRRAVTACAPVLAGQQFAAGALSISSGVACASFDHRADVPRPDVECGELLFRAADSALYRAKAAGRNRVGVA